MALNIGQTWKGANGFSRFLFVLSILGGISTMYAMVNNIFVKPNVDFTKLTWKTKRDIEQDLFNGQKLMRIPKGSIVKVIKSDGIDFVVQYGNITEELTINDLELA